MPLIEWLPNAVLGVVVVAAAIGLIDVRWVWKLRRVRDAEFWLAVIAFAGVVLFGVLKGVVVAVAISIGVFVYRAVRPHDAVLGARGRRRLPRHRAGADRADDPGPRRLPVRRAVFFPNALHFREQVLELVARTSEARVVDVNAEAVTYVDATAIDTLRQLHTDLAERGVVLAFARLKGRQQEIFETDRAHRADRPRPVLPDGARGRRSVSISPMSDVAARPRSPG